MNFNTIKYYYNLGGLGLVCRRTVDALVGTHMADASIYKSNSQADIRERERVVSVTYELYYGKKPDLVNPKTFNEKLQWLKLYDNNPLKTVLADKYLERDWIKQEIGEEYLVPLLGVWDRFEDIDFSSLPEKFALKCNHGSGWNLIVTDKSALDLNAEKKKFDRWMDTNYAYLEFEMQYEKIPRKIIAEEYLDAADRLKDYRFFCFNGEPKQIWVDLYSGTPNHIRSVFSPEWEKVNLSCSWPDGGEQLSEKPSTFDSMLKISEKLSAPFPFVRVDFFEVNGKTYIGEMTFTPMSGHGKFDPPKWDDILGQWIELPKK